MTQTTGKSMRIGLGSALGLVLAAGLLAAPAGADWLVTREGGRVETQGPWQTKGKLVVFKAADGTLSSLRLADVDVEASRKATEEAVRQRAEAQAAPARPAVKEKKPSRIVLTDKDFPSSARAAEPAAPAADTAAPDAAAQPAGLGVANWERAQDPDGSVVVTGTLQNSADTTAADIRLSVELLDDSGKVMVVTQAELSATALPPGQQTGFRAAFPGVFTFADAKFDTKSVNLVSRQSGAPSAPSSSGGGS